MNINTGYGASYANAIPPGAGKVFFICRESTTIADYLGQIIVPDSDGVQRLFVASAATPDVAFNAAITQCVGGRNDYIFVFPGTYTLTAAIVLTGKSSIHLLAANGYQGMDVGTVGATILHQHGSCTTITDNAFCEIAGFQIENMSGYSAIDVPTNIGWTNIHHNLVKFSGATGVDAIFGSSNSSWGSVHHNKIIHWAGTAARSAIYFGNAATVGVTISHNEIIAFGSVVWDYGILYTGAGGLVRDNYICESGGSGAISGGTITVGIEAGVATNVANNRICVATGQGLNGGTANISFSDNRDGQAGGATPITT